MKPIFTKLATFKNRLTRLSDDEPITKLALVIIILLDIFVLSIIFGGLEDHTQQLTSPSEYFPHQCRQVFITKDWTPANKIAKIQGLVLTDYNNYSYRHDSPYREDRINKMHPICREMFEMIRTMTEKKALTELFVDRQESAKRKAQLVSKYDKENEIYDTKLLENIAGQGDPQLNSMAASMKALSREIDRLNGRINDLNVQINDDPLVQEFWALARPGDAEQRERLIADLNHYEKIYLFRELLWQLLFLLPLLALFSLWYSKSLKKDRSIQSLIAAHLLVVASIPIIVKIIELALELIPHHFFESLFTLLERLHIIALWHYFVIIIAILVSVFVIFLIQKKIFNKERLYTKRLAKGICHACGKTLPDRKAAACPFCGVKQFRECENCHTATYIHAQFCTNCGSSLQLKSLNRE